MLLKKYTAWQNKINFFLINSIKNNLIKQMIKIINWNKFRNTIMYKFSYNKNDSNTILNIICDINIYNLYICIYYLIFCNMYIFINIDLGYLYKIWMEKEYKKNIIFVYTKKIKIKKILNKNKDIFHFFYL